MSTVTILEGAPRSQVASPFFNRLPVDLRLMIYLLVFKGNTVDVWFDSEFTKTKLGPVWQHLLFREGQCCFHHRTRSFSLLVTCRKVYMEAFPTYWSSTILHVLRDYYPIHFDGIELQKVCAYLPAPVKQNLRHMRNVKLPVIGHSRPACDESNWAPTLLRDFPKLETCAVPHTGLRRLAAAAGGLGTMHLLRATGRRHTAVFYDDVGPFLARIGESALRHPSSA